MAPVVLAGFSAFLGLYATQPVLPLLERIFRADHGQVTLTVTFATLAVAISAPFMGQIADRMGRKRVIVISSALLAMATLLAATSRDLNVLIFWRFLQGLATPGVFAVTIAYINDEWPVGRAASAVAAYVSGTVLGGFSGRVISGFAAEYLGWRFIFVVLGAMSVAITAVLAWGLPAERGKAGHPGAEGMVRLALAHLGNRRLAATYAAACCVLFTQVAAFTYVTFYLAAAPFRLGPGALGAIFGVYLVGAAITPYAGRAIDRFGHRLAIQIACAMGACGALISLGLHLTAVLAGLTLCSCGVFIANSAATSYIGTVTTRGRALAVGMYVSFYYFGGSLGAAAPGWLWNAWQWRGCVGLIVCVQIALAIVAWFGWPPERSR
jgi:MFS family permease